MSQLLIGHWIPHLPVMEADAEDEVVGLDPAHHRLNLPLSAPDQLVVRLPQVSPARELPVQILTYFDIYRHLNRSFNQLYYSFPTLIGIQNGNPCYGIYCIGGKVAP